jgi:putative transposase
MTEGKDNDTSSSHRHSNRMKGYNYSLAGAYFVTTVAFQGGCLFGDLMNGVLRLNEFGQIVVQSWEWLSEQYLYVELDSYIVMPNHFHGILKN